MSGTHAAKVVAAVTALTAMIGLGIAEPAFAAGTLTKVSWSVNNSQTSKTGVTYSYSFTTATSASISSVTMTVPAGTAGTPGVGTVYGLGAGSASLAGTTLTYTVTTPKTVNAGIALYVSFTGLTNTGTAGSYASTITTFNGATAVDSGASPSVTFGSSSTAVTVTVAQSLTFTNDTPSFALAVDPAANPDQSQPVTLTVKTNAASGYTIAASDTGLSRTSPAATIGALTAGPGTGTATFTPDHFGVSATLTMGGSDGATLAAGLAPAGNYVGYPTTAQTLLSTTGPTGTSADTLVLTNRVVIDYAAVDGTYSDTITYVATPSY